MSDQRQETITVTIDAQGNVTMHVQNVTGDRCVLLTDGIERDLGGEVERSYQPEYFQSDDAGERERQYA